MVKSAVSIAILYTLFAAFSTALNIGAQVLSNWIYSGPYAVEISMIVGTAAGLPLRYVLEKRYIFGYKSNDLVHDGQLFVIYSFMGVFTTAIFWSIEYAFHLVFGTDAMRYLGGVVGLALGFFIKYQLDKKFVFTPKESAAST